MEAKSLEHIELHELEHLRIEEVPRHRDYEAITINDEMESILSRASEQNFVPVVDDQNIFIGLVRRRDYRVLYLPNFYTWRNAFKCEDLVKFA